MSSPGDHPHTAVTVALGAGTSSSGDTLAGFEDVLGSTEGDTLIGDAGSNRLYGSTGDDVLIGLAGNDILTGGRGADAADGGNGTDRCRAETIEHGESASRSEAPVLISPWRQLAHLGI